MSRHHIVLLGVEVGLLEGVLGLVFLMFVVVAVVCRLVLLQSFCWCCRCACAWLQVAGETSHFCLFLAFLDFQFRVHHISYEMTLSI